MPIGIYNVGKQAMCRSVLCPMKCLYMAFVGVEQNGGGGLWGRAVCGSQSGLYAEQIGNGNE